MEVGLPIRADWTLRFDAETNHLPKISNRSQYRRIGLDDAVPICLDEQHCGRVVAVEQEGGGSERHIDSNVECFGECLVYYQQYRALARVSSEDEVQEVIVTTEGRMRMADPSAFDDPNNWWTVIIEQMRQGLL